MTAASPGRRRYEPPPSGLIDAATLHFVVVLPDNPFLAAHVVGSQDFDEVVREARRGLSAHPRRVAASLGLATSGILAARTTAGRPSCKNCMIEVGHLILRVEEPEPPGRFEACRSPLPRRPRPAQRLRVRARLLGRTARTMRSCDSEIQISVYDRPAYLSGSASRCTLAPELLAHFADGGAEARRRRNR